MKINEVDPRNYDSDIDYYNALNRAGRKAYQEPEDREPAEPYDAEDDIAQQRQRAAAKFRQKREVEWDPKTEGTAPNGQKYNSRYIINAVDKSTADMEAHSFTDYHWGAKKLVDSEYGKDGDRVVLTLYIVDNHKHGYWKPWADQPAQESAEQGVAEGFKNTYNVGDRVDSPLGTGVIVAVSPHISVDGRVKVKLDDPSRAGEDGKTKDTFVLDTTQLKHIADEKANPYAIGMAQAMKSTGDKPPLKKSTINKAHEIARAIKKDEK